VRKAFADIRRKCSPPKIVLPCSSKELKDKDSLLGQQLIRKSDVLALRRSEASLGGELGEYLGRIADSKERIAQANERIAQLHSTALRMRSRSCARRRRIWTTSRSRFAQPRTWSTGSTSVRRSVVSW